MKYVKEDRSIVILILLNVVTCGIYGVYFFYKWATDVNTMCEGDNKHTAGILFYLLIGTLTCGIYNLVWLNKLSTRLYENAARYQVNLHDDRRAVLLWTTVGLLLCGWGPVIAEFIIIKNSNKLAVAYNMQVAAAYNAEHPLYGGESQN